MILRFDYILFLFLGIIWGTNFLFMKMSVQVITPMQVAFLRVVFGAIPILLFGLVKKNSIRLSHIKFSHHFLFMGLLNTVIPYVGFIKGTQLLKSGVAGGISGIIPLMSASIAIIFLPEEKMNSRRVWGLILGFIGVALISNLSKVFDQSSNDELLGTVYMLLGSLGYAAAVIYAKKFVTPLKLNTLSLACYQTLAASFILAFVTPYDGIGSIFQSPIPLLALILGLGLLGTGSAFIIYYRLIEKLGAVTASSVFYIPPVVALLVGSVIAKEVIEPIQFFGTILVLAGVYLSKK